jgi:hypothetical protein
MRQNQGTGENQGGPDAAYQTRRIIGMKFRPCSAVATFSNESPELASGRLRTVTADVSWPVAK